MEFDILSQNSFVKSYKTEHLDKKIFIKMLLNQKVNTFLSFFTEDSHRFAKELFDEI